MSETKKRPHQTALRHRILALFTLFFLPGLLMASWATRTPAIRDLLQVSISGMGIVLFGLSVGSMSGILSSGWLVKKTGTRKVINLSMGLVIVGILMMAGSLTQGSPLSFACSLAVFGYGLGSSEVAINIEAALAERQRQKTLLPMMHGFYSLGTLTGAGLGMLLTAVGISANIHILAVGLIAVVPILLALTAITGNNGREDRQPGQSSTSKTHRPFWKDSQLLLIGLIVLAMAFAEGSANDWLPLLMVDGHGFSPASGSLIYAGFTLGMTTGRFCGGWFIDRYSREAVVRASAIMGACGIALVIFIDNSFIAGLAVIFWGLGSSLGFPLTISAASDTGPDAATRVSIVAITGYIAFLVGPPLLGFLGEHYGLRSAMLVVMSLVILAAIVARAVARPSRSFTSLEGKEL